MNPNGIVLFGVDDVYGVYCDAFVADDAGQMLFASFWGRDTSVQELLARLSLPASEGGLWCLRLIDQDNRSTRSELTLGDADRLEKLTGRMPKANLFGDVGQLWLYDRLAVKPDYAGRRALRLFPASTEPESDAIWQMAKDVCHLPLIDPWRDRFIREARDREWIRIHPGTGISALALHMKEDEVEPVIEDMIRKGRLTLPEDTAAARVRNPSPEVETANPGTAGADDPGRLSPARFAEQLLQFTGTTVWYRHNLVREMTYTDGVQFFAENGGGQGAYWFLDLVATEVFPLLKRHPFLSIELIVADESAAVEVEDGNGKRLLSRPIEYTDMQPGTWKFYLTDNVLLLPSEY